MDAGSQDEGVSVEKMATADDLKLCPWPLPCKTFVTGQLMKVVVRGIYMGDADHTAIVHLDMGQGHYGRPNSGYQAVSAALNKFCPDQPPAVIRPGEKVAVLHMKVWYRAFIIEELTDHSVLVTFVDDLVTQTVGHQFVRQLPVQVDAMPLLAYQVKGKKYTDREIRQVTKVDKGRQNADVKLRVRATSPR